jgi:cytidylate kinase
MAIHVKASADIPAAINTFDYEISLDPNHQVATLQGVDITTDIRSAETAALVRPIAQDLSVRALQKQDARNRISACDKAGIIVEGRDITTVVAPQAQVRILLTASQEVRLARRAKDATEESESLILRDSSDSQVAEFMSAAPGVVEIDTTELDFEQSVQALLGAIEAVRNV